MTRKLIISNIAVGVLLALGLTYVLIYLVRYNPLDPPYEVTVQMAETGGLYTNSDVTYLGDPVGEIGSIKPVDGGVEVTVRIDPDVKIPQDTEAVVAGLSPVGEQYLDFRPRSEGGPYLGEGDVVAKEDTSTPIAFATMMRHVYELAVQIKPGPIATVVTELSAGLGGSAVDLRRIVVDSGDLLDTLVETQPDMFTLLTDGHTVLRTAVDLRPQLARFSRSARQLAHELERGIPTWRDSLRQVPPALDEIFTVVDETTPELAAFMDDVAPFLSVLNARGSAITALLHETPAAVAALSPWIHDGWLNGIVYLAPTSDQCDYGSTELPAPWVARDPDFHPDRHCTTYGPNLEQRGAYYAPRP